MVGKNRLSRSSSLKSRVEIKDLLENGKRFPTDFFTIVWKPAEDFSQGVFLSRRIAPAHQRNRLKRLYREAVRLSRKHLEKSGKVAILPRPTESDPDLKQLVEDVTYVFERINNEK